MMTDSVGDSLWLRSYGGLSGEEFYEAQETSDGNIIVGGISGEAATNGWWGLYALKIDMNGDTLWTRRFNTIGSDYCKSIQQCSDGGYIMGGTSNLNGDASLYMVKLDKNGDSLWNKKFGSFQDKEYGFFVRQTYDGGYIITGMTSNSVDVYLIKTDSLGNLITGINEIDALEMDFNIYPNPTQDIINIRSGTEMDKIQLFDINGKLLFVEESVKSKESTINMGHFSSGIYYLHVLTSKVTGVRKIVKL
jgi:hypothetical protein